MTRCSTSTQRFVTLFYSNPCTTDPRHYHHDGQPSDVRSVIVAQLHGTQSELNRPAILVQAITRSTRLRALHGAHYLSAGRADSTPQPCSLAAWSVSAEVHECASHVLLLARLASGGARHLLLGSAALWRGGDGAHIVPVQPARPEHVRKQPLRPGSGCKQIHRQATVRGGKTSGDRQRVATYEGATAMR